MDTTLWKHHAPDAQGLERYEYAGAYPGTRIEIIGRKASFPLESETLWHATLTNTATGKAISLEEYGDLEDVAADVVAKVQDPFAPFSKEYEYGPWYNGKLRIIGVIPRRTFDYMHAQGARTWAGKWLAMNDLIKHTVRDYGLDPFENKELCTALAYAVCSKMYGEPVAPPALPDAPQGEEQEETLLDEAIEMLDGHTVLTEPNARRICILCGVPFEEALVMHWRDAVEAQTRYGIFGAKYNSGVSSLDLSYYVCGALGIKAPGHGFTGKGFQAQANQKALRAHFEEKVEETQQA